MTELKIKVSKMPENCLSCTFNQNKYCALKMAIDDGTSNFVQNNRETIDMNCPLVKYQEIELWKEKVK